MINKPQNINSETRNSKLGTRSLKPRTRNSFLPTSVKEMKILGWDRPDIILFSGDAYIDHPAFGIAVIARVLENKGFKVVVVPQPNWQDDLRDFKKFGLPKLFFGVSAGNMDSMINHYTANKRLRSDDPYTPGNKAGHRPDYASIVYSKILKNLYPETPVILGGIEASLRRLTHFDYWSNKLKPGILIESKADMLVYGMAEESICNIAKKLKDGQNIKEIQDEPQTAFLTSSINSFNNKDKWESKMLYPHEECIKNKNKFAENFKHIETESNRLYGSSLIQKFENSFIIVNPPTKLIKESDLDEIYNLPFTRLPHPRYAIKDKIPAYEMIKHSVTLHRGCFGGCSFCTISAHQGKFISSRSEKSILNELEQIIKMPDFKGYISDIGGPSANMYKLEPIQLSKCTNCIRPSCIFPGICQNLNTDHKTMVGLYKKIREITRIKKAFVSSGIRYDLFLQTHKNHELNKNNSDYCNDLIKYHVSGRLKVAPEHTSDNVLKIIRKPSFKLFYDLKRIFDRINLEANIKQQIIPYFISSHPSCSITDMAELSVITKKLQIKPEQVQDFTPTPKTLATVMYYTGIDPYSGKNVYTAKTKEDKLSQRKYFFWYKKEFRRNIKGEMEMVGRKDIIKKLFS